MQTGLAPAAPRYAAALRFVATVALRFDTPLAIGETADGVRFDFWVEGLVRGPELNGRFPRCAAYRHRQNPRILSALRHRDELELKHRFGSLFAISSVGRESTAAEP